MAEGRDRDTDDQVQIREVFERQNEAQMAHANRLPARVDTKVTQLRGRRIQPSEESVTSRVLHVRFRGLWKVEDRRAELENEEREV